MKLQRLQLLTAVAVSAGVALSAGLALFSLSSHSASSQAVRTIKIVVPSPPGGAADAVARLLADQIGRSRAQTILIENRAGAGGMIAAEAVSRATPDGNMLLIMHPDALVPPHLRKLDFDVLDGFEHICELVSAPVVVVVNGSSAYRTLADLIGAARARPGELTLAAFGPATSFQIAIERLKHAANVNMTYLPYSGAAPVVNAVLGDHVTAGLMTYSTASEHFNAGKLRALATTSRTRVQPLPDVPAIGEAGYKDAEMDDWWVGISAPVKTPKDRLSQLADWFRSALESPELKAKLAALGFYSVGICGTDFARLLRKQYDEFGRVIREADVKAE